MKESQELAAVLVEGEEDQKAKDLLSKWDKAHAKYTELAAQKRAAAKIFSELGQAISLDRELARLGLQRKDVEGFIEGRAIGATDNYKHETPIKVCMKSWCGLHGKAQGLDLTACAECGEPLTGSVKKTAPSDLRGKFSNHSTHNPFHLTPGQRKALLMLKEHSVMLPGNGGNYGYLKGSEPATTQAFYSLVKRGAATYNGVFKITDFGLQLLA